MTTQRPPIREATDDDLVALARTDEREAYGELYRRHVGAARSTARWMLHSAQDVDDVVSEAFAGALAALRNGNGPRDNFRFYLLASVRNGCMRRCQRSRSTPTDPTTLSEIGPSTDTTSGMAEANTVTRAFSTLSPRWQRMLWMTEVERRPVGEVAMELQMSASAVSAVSQRARHAFASAYLNEHVAVSTDPRCSVFGPRLGKYVRGEAGEIDVRRIEHHLETCDSCRKTVDDLRDVNACLRELQLPGGLAGIGTAALATTGAAGAGSAVIGGWAGSALAGWVLKAAIVVLVAAPLVAADSPHGNTIAAPGSSTTVVAPTPGPAGAGGTGTGATTPGGSAGGTGTGVTSQPGAIDPSLPGATTPGGVPVLGGALPIESGTTPVPGTPTIPGAPGVTVPGGVSVTIPGGVGVTVTVPSGAGAGVGVTTPVAGAGVTVTGSGVTAGVTVTTPGVAGGVGVDAGTGGASAGGSATAGSTTVTVGAGVGGSTGGVSVGVGATSGAGTVAAGATAGTGGVSAGGGVAVPPITLPIAVPPIVIPPLTVPKIVITLPHG